MSMLWQERVKKIMKDNFVSQKELSKKSGIAESSLSRYLNEDKPVRTDILINIAKALNINVNYLYEEENTKFNNPYTEIATVIARNGGSLTADEKNKLISLILGAGE